MRHAPATCGLLLLFAGAAAPAAQLQVLNENHKLLLSLDLAAQPCWSIRWNHSVTGVQVEDYYCFRGNQMLLTASHTPAFDAGLGHIPGRGRLESDAAHGYWIRDIDEPVPGASYWLRVGAPTVDHRIAHGGHEHSLSALAARQRVQIRIHAGDTHDIR